MLTITLADWGHDQAFAASPLSDTLPLSNATVFTTVSFVPTSKPVVGSRLGLGCASPAIPRRVDSQSRPADRGRRSEWATGRMLQIH